MAFFSDAHGNAEALATVIEHAQACGAEAMYFLGDALGYLPWGEAVLDLLAHCQAVCLKGNHEAMALGELPLDPQKDRIYGLARTSKTLSDAHRTAIRSWPQMLRVQQEDLTICLVHGTPAAPLQGYLHPDGTFDFLADSTTNVLVCGHTHRPYILFRHGVVIVNAGSCGLPRDNGGLAAYALLDTTAKMATIHRVPFACAQTTLAALPEAVRRCLARRAPCPMRLSMAIGES
jgi:putative phosphoesterase